MGKLKQLKLEESIMGHSWSKKQYNKFLRKVKKVKKGLSWNPKG